MHTYPQLWSDGARPEFPITSDDVFTCAEDVVAKAALWPLMGRATFPEVWHLDPDGHYECGWQASSLDTLVGWAEEPEWLQTHLWHSRADGCRHDRWVIVDSRPTELPTRERVGELDAWAFGRLRHDLARSGINLVDAVVFDDRQHWWSMRELTMRTTSWSLEEPSG